MSNPTYEGSCHCGFITYKVAIPPKQDTLYSCNCTMCQKPGYTSIHLETDKAPLTNDDGSVNTIPVTSHQFKLISPASVSEIKDYQPKNKAIHRFLCDRCGVHVWGCGRVEIPGAGEDGQGMMIYEFFGLNAKTLLQPQEGLDLMAWKVVYYDGLNDNWRAGGKEKPWPGSVP